jgi:pimeloyl-ACP methyl ester carboxylesterase
MNNNDNKDTAIVVFNGRQQKFGINTTEFNNTLLRIGYKTNTFISDTTKTWYNGEGVFDPLLLKVQRFVDSHSDKRIVFMGSSMGGFGAILFASFIPRCTKVVAFSPQIAIDPKLTVPWDERYLDSVGKLRHFPFPTVENKFRRDIPYNILYGSEEPKDRKHLDIIGNKLYSNVTIDKCVGAGHNVPAYLKSTNTLDTTLLDLLK